MGYYIQTPGPKMKSRWLVDTQGGVYISPRDVTDDFFDKLPDDKVLVCVVDNGPFEAAGIAFSLQELHAFRDGRGDTRLKRWVLLDKDKVALNCPEYRRYLSGVTR